MVVATSQVSTMEGNFRRPCANRLVDRSVKFFAMWPCERESNRTN